MLKNEASKTNEAPSDQQTIQLKNLASIKFKQER